MGESFNDCKKMEGPGRRFLKHLAAKLELVIVVFDKRRQIHKNIKTKRFVQSSISAVHDQ